MSEDFVTTKTGLKIPRDVYEITNFLRGMRSEFSDLFACQTRDLIHDLIADLNKWREGGDKPDWNAFRLNINQSCYDDGMPALFESIEEVQVESPDPHKVRTPIIVAS